MNKYFISYRYTVGYQDGTGDRIYETDSTILSFDIDLIESIYDLKGKILKQELSWVVKNNSDFNKYDIDILIINKL